MVRKESRRPAASPATSSLPAPSFPGALTACLPPAPADSMIRVGTNYQAVIPECKPGEWQGQAAEGGAFRAPGLALSPTWGSPWPAPTGRAGRQAGSGAGVAGGPVARHGTALHGEFSCAAFLSGSLSLLSLLGLTSEASWRWGLARWPWGWPERLPPSLPPSPCREPSAIQQQGAERDAGLVP